MQIAVIGATGAVGKEIVKLLEIRKFPVQILHCFASKNSIGKTISFRGKNILLKVLNDSSTFDLAFFAAGSAVSKEWIPKMKCICIDSSSYFRKKEPLIIPEINAHVLKNTSRIISSPNCAATILLMPLFPLHKLYRVKRAVVTTYQAASGGGDKLVKRLENETQRALLGKNLSALPYAFNLFPHNSKLDENGYVEEELKIRDETRKILEDDAIQLSATCIRVPVLRAHSISANVAFHHQIDLEEAIEAVKQMPGVTLFEDRENNRFATPFDATGKNEVLCGRFRIDPSQPNTLEFWSVGDQLLKGAALNAVQIAENLINFQNIDRQSHQDLERCIFDR